MTLDQQPKCTQSKCMQPERVQTKCTQKADRRQEPRRVRSIFVSDLHLGMRNARAADLESFLSRYHADNVYLVGDIIDGWKLKKRWVWPEAYNSFVARLARIAESGTRVIVLPGNHDAFLRPLVGLSFGAIELHDRLIHTGIDGKRYLVLHGDQFDGVVSQYHWLSRLGHWAYGWALLLNRPINSLRHRLGLHYWSLSAWGKTQVKQATAIKNWYAEALVREAEIAGADGVICGHIHIAEIHQDYGIDYLNCGDWVESRTAIIEDLNGRFSLLHWETCLENVAPAPSRTNREAAHA